MIDSTISKDIGGALQSVNSIQNSLRQDEQQLLFPVALINQSHNYIHTIVTSYRSWMAGVFTLPINSAQLPAVRHWKMPFSAVPRLRLATWAAFTTPLSVECPGSGRAETHRQMMDMDDALAKDSLAQSVAADQVSGNLIQIANQIESEAATTAPGTADILSATARAANWKVWPASTNSWRPCCGKRAATLAHHNGILKQSVGDAQQLNTNLQGTIGQ